MRRVAEGTDARLVVTGSYYAAADDIVFEVAVHDAAKEEVIFSTEPIRADRDDPTTAFEPLREGLFGFLALRGLRLSGEDVAEIRQTQAPSYAAYREFALGAEAFRALNFRRAAEFFEQAASLDSTFFGALSRGATSHMNAVNYPAAQLLDDRMELMRARLSTSERALLDWSRGWLDGDLQRAHDGAARTSELSPTSPAKFLASMTALSINRPREASDYFKEFDWKRMGGSWAAYWSLSAAAHHQLGRHGTELRLIRQGRAQHPEHRGILVAELAALAALGKGDDVWQLVDDVELAGLFDLQIWRVANELDAHGDPALTQRLLERLLQRQERASASEQQGRDWRFRHGRTLAYLNRNHEARSVFQALFEDDGRPDSRFWSAVLAARVGDRETAEQAIAWFGARTIRYENGKNVLQQAYIAAELGDAERTVRFLQQAEEQGTTVFRELHVDPHFAAVRDDPLLRAYEKPRG